MDHSKTIFGNTVSNHVYKKALKSKKKFIKKYGDDSKTIYHLNPADIPVISEEFGVSNLALTHEPGENLADNAIIIGNIRMGFGHYRISMAMASCANALGYKPYWMDLCSYDTATCGKIISYQNDLYSMGSRLSQKFSLFNKLVWEPMNSEGFRKLSYNAADQKNSELMTPVFRDIPKDTPFIATHVWPAQAAVHAGMTQVVNAIPDNWPMALHLAEGSIHTVQTPSSYLGYKALRGMEKGHVLSPMPDDSLVYTGHYVDHELVVNIEKDNEKRKERMTQKAPKRYLMTVGGAGAQRKLFATIIRLLMPAIQKDEAVLFVNVGDHENVWHELCQDIKELKGISSEHFDDFEETKKFTDTIYDGEVHGIHAFCHQDIFAAVYSTNLLMRCSDVMITKPSELSFYPIPKLLIKRVGGHEAWGAIRAAEVGDGTYECDTPEDVESMLNLLQNDNATLMHMITCIETAHQAGIYNGGYEAVKLAVNQSSSH